MAKISTGTHVFDAATFISSADATSISFLSPGSIVVGGVTSVVGSTGLDRISFNLPTAYKPVGFTLDTFTAFNLDTKNTLASTTDTLTGTSSNDTVNLTNSGTAAMVNVRYASGGGTDTVNLTTASDNLSLSLAFTGTIDSNGGVDTITGSTLSDTITLGEDSAQANWFYGSGSSAVDTLTGTSFADLITLTSASKINFTTGGGADVIKGSDSADTVTVISSTEVTVSGGLGADNIILSTTAAVSDVVQFNSRSDSSALVSSDVITNFQAGTGSTSVDTLKFNGLQLGTFDYLGFGSMFTGGGDNSEARSMQSGANLIIEIDANADTQTDMVITLLGVSLSVLDVGDFSWV